MKKPIRVFLSQTNLNYRLNNYLCQQRLLVHAVNCRLLIYCGTTNFVTTKHQKDYPANFHLLNNCKPFSRKI